MDNQKIPREADIHKLLFRSLGKDSTTSLLGCGFLKKTGSGDSYIQARFPHFGAVWVLRGRGEYRDFRGQTFPLGPGSVFLRVPGELHSSIVYPDGQWLECYVAFGSPYFRGLSAMGQVPETRRVFSVPMNSLLISRWLGLSTALEKAESHNLPEILLECTSLYFTLISSPREGSRDPEYQSTFPDPVKRAMVLLGPEYSKSPREIAADLGIGYSQLRKLFLEAKGITMVEYRIQRRIEQAKNALLYTNESIKTLAEGLGYADGASFSKQFKGVMGMNPTQWRRDGRKNPPEKIYQIK